MPHNSKSNRYILCRNVQRSFSLGCSKPSLDPGINLKRPKEDNEPRPKIYLRESAIDMDQMRAAVFDIQMLF